MTAPAEAPSSESPSTEISPTDARLVLPALAAWAGAFLGTAGGWVLAAAVLAAGVIVWVALHRLVGRTTGLVAAAAVTLLGGGIAVGGIAHTAVTSGPVPTLAAAGATVVTTAEVTSDPTRLPPRVSGTALSRPLVLVPLRLAELTARGRRIRAHVPVLGFADDRRWAGLLPGQAVRVTGRLGPARTGQPVAATLTVRGPPVRIGRPPVLQTVAGDLRAGLRTAADGLPTAERGLLPGLVVGDTSRLPPELAEDFRTAGLTHLVAVSGANLAIVSGFVLLVGRQVGLRRRARIVVAALAMLGFVVLARPQPSVLRAAVMGAVALAALASGRRRPSLAALSATVVLLVLVDPWLARSFGFVLSVLATGALVTLAPGWARRWRAAGLPSIAAHGLAVPLAAQLVCGPVVVLLSEQVSLVAVPANILVAPAVAPATVLGVLATVASAVHPAAAVALAWLAGGFVWWIVRVATWSAALPSAAVAWPGSVRGACLLAAVTVVGVLVVPRLAQRRLVAACLAAAVAALLVAPVRSPGWPPRDWLLAVCDVGQGDALALAAGPGTAVVVDAGPDPEAVDRCLRRLGVRRVPLVVLTHLHADHVEGLAGVLRGRQVGEVEVGLLAEPAEELVRVRRWASSAGVPVTRALVGDHVRLGGLSWQVLWPARVVRAGSVPNNASVVLLVRSRGVSMLLTGDVEPEAQRAMLARGGLGRVDVLKVAHHGSANQEPQLLRTVPPRIAVISVGADNDYGHPAPPTLAELRRAGALVGRTDDDGTLLVAGSRSSVRLVTGGG